MMLSPYTDVLQDEMLREIARRGDVRAFPALSTLLREGDTTDAFYILLSGRVKVFGTDAKGREVVYNTLGPGEYFGELSLDGSPRSASVQSLEPVHCVLVRGAEMRAFLGQHPDFALHLIRHLIGLLRRGSYRPQAGWGRFVLQVLAASALLVIYLLWAAGLVDWVALRSHSLLRIAWLTLLLGGAMLVYLGAAWAAGLNLRQFLRR